MKRNIVNIGSHRYLVEYYDANIDMTNSEYLSEFVMIRNFSIVNNVVNDSDICFIERKYLDEYIQELKESKTEIGYKLVFPVTDSAINSYSTSYLNFNSDFNFDNNSSIYYEDEYGDSIYEIYEKINSNLIRKKIKCDKIRIYHPFTKTNIDAIIDISNYINGIHIHYLCKNINDFNTNSETEIKIDNETYSEFIELYVPNIEDLFKINEDGTYNTFYKEDLDIIVSTQNENFINSILSSSNDIEHSEETDDGEQIVPINLLIQPYRIIEEVNSENKLNFDNNLSNDDKTYVKLYLKNNLSIDNNYLSYPLDITIFPYSYIDEQLKLYIIDDNYPAVTTSFTNESKFSLSSVLGFSNGILSIISFFDYPNKSYYYNKYKDDIFTSPFKEAYIYFNNIDEDNYNKFTNYNFEEQIKNIDNVTSINDDIKKSVIAITNTAYSSDEEILKVWKTLMKESLQSEYEEEYGTPINFLGFKVEISTNENFTNVIYDKNVNINIGELDDCSFALNGIFNNWNQFPEKLIGRVTFFDKFLGIQFVSNVVIISNEWKKYLINDNNIHRLKTLSNINYNIGNNDNMKSIKLNEDNINFINNVKCIINKKTDNSNISLSNTSQKVIYKPIFYNVKDLQNIKLRRGLSQNIGVNLSNYMTKVEIFKLIIDNTEYIEVGRNDIYVIFNINASLLNEESGYYNITNQDDEYISSGNWVIY